MGDPDRIELADLERAVLARSPELARQVLRYALQEDLPPGTTDDPSAAHVAVPADAWTVARVRAVLSKENLAGKDEDERKALRKSAFDALHASPYAPERLRLAPLIIGLYEQPWARTALLTILEHVRLRWGTWKAFKTIYKRVETDHDAELFGVLAYRLDATSSWPSHVDQHEVSSRTVAYLRRRAWRYLRWLGQSVPELYPEMAVQVLRHYPRHQSFASPWVAAHIMAARYFRRSSGVWFSDSFALDDRAFSEAWKRSPAPLLRLLEDAEHDNICAFAIRSLKHDFPEALRHVDAAWLLRVGQRGVPVSQELVVDALGDNPAFHQSRLRDLGLEDMVIDFLVSENAKVSEYAKEYIKAHVPKLDLDRMIALAERGARTGAAALLLARLADQPPRTLGIERLFRLMTLPKDFADLARQKLLEGFTPADFDLATFVAYYSDQNGVFHAFLDTFYEAHKTAIPTAYLIAVLEQAPWQLRTIQAELRRRPGVEIGMAWFKRALFDRRTADLAANLLLSGALTGEHLDVEWVKELTRRPTQRALALRLLGNASIIAPAAIGAPFLLRLLTRADPTLQAFGRSTLLSHFGPEDFEGGIDGVFALAKSKNERGRKQPEALRTFAFDWLRMHHPEINAESAEARSLGVQPRVSLDAYALARIAPFFADTWTPARQFAADIAQKELHRWNDERVPYSLAESAFVETRRLGIRALLSIGRSEEGAAALPEEWLSGERVFQMAESHVKATRELALTLIREHYARIGGKEKLAWLMESPDREVRLFAVRLLYEQHRPSGAGRERFESTDALAAFLRTILFGLPPGRMERREGEAVDRPLRSGVAKRRLIELLRDLALDDAPFAALIAPLLSEFVHAEARGEWQAAVAALASLRRRHPGLDIALPEGSVEARPVQAASGLRGLA